MWYRVGGLAAVGLLLVAGCAGEAEPAGPSPAPSVDPTGPGLHELTLESGGAQRSYLLEVPESYDPAAPTPLIVVLHPGRGNPEKVRSASGMPELAQRYGVLVAYPAGEGRFWRPRLAGEHGVGVEFGGDPVDVEFLRRLVEWLVDEWHVAPGQVYATGHSNGAAMTYRLAAEAGDLFAAIAPVGGYLFDPPESIEPAEPVSVVGFVALDADATDEIAAGIQTWRDRLGCEPGEPATEERITRVDASCRDGSEVVEYRIEGMGHVWPREPHGIDATAAMWEFFQAHAR
jgi:polyhydroxybutyrate depolymerase